MTPNIDSKFVTPFSSHSTSDIYLTAVCLIVSKNQLVIGRSDGSIIIADALSAIESALFKSTNSQSETDIFISSDGHFDAITCIYYPAAVSSERYDSDVIWVGSRDFSVSVWSLSLKCRLGGFHNHIAPILRLEICPTTGGRAAGTILSVDVDGGVCMLSLREQLCLLSDAGFGNQILSIDWTLDGFLMIQRENGILKV